MNVVPDIIAELYFYPTDKGGLKNKIGGGDLNCPLRFGDKLYDARIFLGKNTYINPGDRITLPIKFLLLENVQSYLKVNTRFYLYTFRDYAEGRVIEVK